MVTNRQKQTAGIVAATLLLLGSAYAWYSSNQHKTNTFRTPLATNDVTLVEDFVPIKDWQEGQEINKNISVKNNTDVANGNNAYLRIQLKEFLEFTDRTETPTDKRYAVDTSGDFVKFATESEAQAYATANNLGAPEYITETAFEGANQWFIPTQAEATNGQYGKVLILSVGNGTTQSIIDATVANASADATDKHQDETNGEDDYTTQLFSASGADINAKRWYDETKLVTAYPTDTDGIVSGKDLKDYISWTFGPDVTTLDDFDAATATKAQWVIDTTTGWVYWSQALAPGQTTEHFLDSLTLTSTPKNVALYYAIHTNLEAVDKDDIGKMNPPEEIINAWGITPKYTVTFDSKGGVPEPSPQEVEVGEKLKAPAVPTKPGQDFGGWYATADCSGNAWNFAQDTMPNGAFTLYAKWTVATYTVNVNASGGSGGAASPDRYTYHPSESTEIALTRPTAPTGKTFGSWNASTETSISGDTLTIAANATGNKTVTVNWEAVDYTVTFVANGGTPAPSAQTLTYGDKITEPAAPTKTGYTFGGWYADENLSGEAWNFDTDTLPASNLTLYAKWTLSQFKVTFHNNSGETADTQITVDYDTVFSAPSPAPTLTGWTINAWYEDPEFAGTAWNFSADKLPARDLDLYAKWTRDQFNVVYQNGETTLATVPHPYGLPFAPPTEPTNPGYTFAGWYADEGLTGNAWDFDANTMPASTLTLYAKWSVGVYDIGLNANGGSGGSVNPETYTYNASGTTIVALTKPTTPTGKVFKDWAVPAGTSITGDTMTILAGTYGDKTVTAEWDDIPYTITVAPNGGSGGSASPTSYVYKAGATTTITLTKPTPATGKAFSSWSAPSGTSISGDTLTITAGTTGDKTVTANWSDATYAVSVAANGGSGGSASPTSYTYKAAATTAITLTRPTAPSYKEFDSWTAPAGTTVSGNTLTITAGTTGAKSVTANWKDIKYTLSFESNGGSAVASQSLAYGAKATQPTAPTKTGHTFAGWCSDSSLTTAWNFSTNTMPAENKKLYAKWTANTYNITYVVREYNDNSYRLEKRTGTYGQTIPNVGAVAGQDDGYDFGGWYKDRQFQTAWNFSGDTMPANDLVIYALWLPPVGTSFGVTLHETGPEVDFNDEKWRMLDQDIDNNPANGWQCLIQRNFPLLADEAGGTESSQTFRYRASSNQYFSASGANGYDATDNNIRKGLETLMTSRYNDTFRNHLAKVKLNNPTFTQFKSGITFSNNGDGTPTYWEWNGANPNNYKCDNRFYTTYAPTDGTKQYFALSFGDINYHIGKPSGNAIYKRSYASFLRSPGQHDYYVGAINADGTFTNNNVDSLSAVYPATVYTYWPARKYQNNF